MNDDELQRIIEQLDEQIPTEGAFIQFRLMGTEYGLSANRLGYLRLGVEMLRAASLPTEKLPDADVELLPLDLEHLRHEDDREHGLLEWFERTEQLHKEPEVEVETRPSLGSRLISLTMILLTVIFCIGLFDVLRWLFGLVASLF